MAKKKLEIRKPLTEREAIAPQPLRPVAPVPTAEPVSQPEPKQAQEPEEIQAAREAPTQNSPKPQLPAPQKNELKRYATYLSPKSIKKIKLHAVETDMPDYSVVQAAIDAYFEKRK